MAGCARAAGPAVKAWSKVVVTALTTRPDNVHSVAWQPVSVATHALGARCEDPGA